MEEEENEGGRRRRIFIRLEFPKKFTEWHKQSKKPKEHQKIKKCLDKKSITLQLFFLFFFSGILFLTRSFQSALITSYEGDRQTHKKTDGYCDQMSCHVLMMSPWLVMMDSNWRHTRLSYQHLIKFLSTSLLQTSMQSPSLIQGVESQ